MNYYEEMNVKIQKLLRRQRKKYPNAFILTAIQQPIVIGHVHTPSVNNPHIVYIDYIDKIK